MKRLMLTVLVGLVGAGCTGYFPQSNSHPGYDPTIDYADTNFLVQADQDWFYHFATVARIYGPNQGFGDPIFGWYMWRYGYKDYSTDGCSIVPDVTYVYNFTAPCNNHDFCYRNFKRNDAWWGNRGYFWNPNVKLFCDNVFWGNMTLKCEPLRADIRVACAFWRDVLYSAVVSGPA